MTVGKIERGFTLLEMAVVLVIVGLMLGGLLVPLSTQMDQKNYSETKQDLTEIRNALLGFAILYGRLPCPTTTTDPANAAYGIEDASCSSASTAEGYLPWKTLGVSEVDSWGSKRKVATDPWTGYWRYRVDRNFSNQAVLPSLTTGFSADALMVQNSAGNALLSTAERPVAVVFSTGKDKAANGENADFEVASGLYESDALSSTFDDVLVFISRPILMNRLVESGKLPQ